MIEVNPEFSGGTQKLYKFIETNLNSPNKTEYSGKKIMLKFIVEKGSVCLDGISLTVAAVGESDFKVSVIPHTGGETTLLKK